MNSLWVAKTQRILTLVKMSSRQSKRTVPPVNYNEEAIQEAAANNTGTHEIPNSKKARKDTTGWKELDGKAPYRDDYQRGIGAEILKHRGDLPTRNKAGELVFKDHPDFRPNLTPEQIIRLGAFGGTYWRPITSGVTGQSYSECWKEFPKEWHDGVPQSHICRSWKQYNTAVNRYGVKCGGSLDMWESSGWIADIDPYGWYQWYCRYYLGRRTSDDARQVDRWIKCASPKGRFRNQLIGRCAKAGTTFDDEKISPVIRQSLLHWGKIITEAEAEQYVKLKKLPQLRKSKSDPIDFATLSLPLRKIKEKKSSK
eukprot:m.872913 g.872913  ORF g.872913 m.872913 type:complete len:312 (-) comp23572_c1_seq13:162-1097(-)